MARNRNITDGGGGGGSAGVPDGDDTDGSSADMSDPPTSDPEPSSTDSQTQTDTAPATAYGIPDDIQTSDPANDSTSQSESGGAGTDTGTGVDTTPDGDTGGESASDTGGVPDDIQTSDPANDSTSQSESGGAGTDTGTGVDTTPDGDTGGESASDTGSSDPDGSVPEGVQNEGPAGSEPDEPDYRAGPGRTPGGTDSTDSDGDGGVSSEIEQRYVAAREYLADSDVRTVIEDGQEQLRLTASGAAAQFAANTDGVNRDDVTATNNGDGGFDVQFTDEYLEEQAEEEFSRGPRGAGETISGETGISDDGSPNDPLEGTGLEAGLGETADTARDIESRVTADAPGSARGVQDAGASGPDLTDEDVEVVIGDDGTFTVQRARDTLTPTQAQNIDEPPRQDPTQLERESTSGVTPDYQTAAGNELEEEIEGTLRQMGIDPATVDVEERAEEQVAPEAEQGGAKGWLNTQSDRFQEAVSDNAEAGGDLAGQTIADMVLGPFASGPVAGDAVDVATAFANQQTSVDVEELEDTYTESVFEGAASVGNIPELALGATEAVDDAVWAVGEVAEGDAGEVVDAARDRAAVSAAQFAMAAEENPVEIYGQTSGALAGSAVVSGGTSLAASARGISAAGTARRVGSRVRSAAGRSRVPEFLDDTRGQADWGTEATQLTRQRDADAEAEESVTSFDAMEDEGIVTVRNQDSGTSTDQLSDVEAEARQRLPDREEYPSQTEFDRELTQQMRQIEQRRTQATESSVDEATSQLRTRTTTAGAAGAGIGATTAVEATAFRDGDSAVGGLMGAETAGLGAAATETSALAQSDQVAESTLSGVESAADTVGSTITATTEGVTGTTTDTVGITGTTTDTTGITDTTTATDTTAVTGTTTSVPSTTTTGLPTLTSPSRPRAPDLDIGDDDEDAPFGAGFGEIDDVWDTGVVQEVEDAFNGN